MSHDQPLEQSLCLSCGLCCDGTLFEVVPLKENDNLIILQTRNIQLQTKEAGSLFKQPCPAYQHNCCQIYTDRPANCRDFRCALLKNYERGNVTWEAAQQVISRTRQLRDLVRRSLQSILPESAHASVFAVLKTAPTQEEMTADPQLLKTWGTTMMQMSALIDCFQLHFRPPNKEQAEDILSINALPSHFSNENNFPA